ncbi:hypothetical protein BSIN_3261 [Burkholderia singularis]|uniref:Uncharacterized protein n=1 Tax=Burkholderia singularis TaxID=1503053 RepID=A0A238H450_9BURK|nr:hypothetical protein BSIN_3261 [Burkholderia singularis]
MKPSIQSRQAWFYRGFRKRVAFRIEERGRCSGGIREGISSIGRRHTGSIRNGWVGVAALNPVQVRAGLSWIDPKT